MSCSEKSFIVCGNALGFTEKKKQTQKTTTNQTYSELKINSIISRKGVPN